jgi:phage tail sheath protein FI
VGLAQNRGNVFLVLDPPPGYTPTAMQTWALNLSFRTEKAAVYYPQLVIADPYSPTAGATRTVPPGGFVTGMYIQTDQTRSVAKAPAGLGTSLLGVYGVEPTGVMTNADQGNLNTANVNCLVSVPGSGVVIWGARTLSAYLVTRYVSVERSIIYLSSQMVAMTKFAVFEPNDWILWNHITSVLSQFLNEFWQSGGLSGTSAAQAFYVTCDGTNNTLSTIQQGIVNVEVGVSLQFPAEFVVIKIGQWAGGQSVSVTNT